MDLAPIPHFIPSAERPTSRGPGRGSAGSPPAEETRLSPTHRLIQLRWHCETLFHAWRAARRAPEVQVEPPGRPQQWLAHLIVHRMLPAGARSHQPSIRSCHCLCSMVDADITDHSAAAAAAAAAAPQRGNGGGGDAGEREGWGGGKWGIMHMCSAWRCTHWQDFVCLPALHLHAPPLASRTHVYHTLPIFAVPPGGGAAAAQNGYNAGSKGAGEGIPRGVGSGAGSSLEEMPGRPRRQRRVQPGSGGSSSIHTNQSAQARLGTKVTSERNLHSRN